MFWRERHSRDPQGFSRGGSPKSVSRHIAAHYRSRPDHRSLADSYIRQDDTVRPDKNIVFNDNSTVASGSPGSRIEMRDDRRSEADCGIVPDSHFGRMYLIDINKLADPDVATDFYAAQPLQPRP